MVALWMVYAAVVSALVVAAGVALERAVVRSRRWLWAAVLMLAAVLPLLAPSLRERLFAPRGLEVLFGPAMPVVGGALAGMAAPGASGGWNLGTLLAGVWVGASLVLLAVLVFGAVRVRRRAAGWPRRLVDGVPVLLSDDVGPAVVGFTAPEIVLPPWVLELGAGERALILAHEQEHQRRADPALMALALLVPVAMPWNPALWWGFVRLREAVETDCDRRVLARQDDRAGGAVSYARLLVDVGARTLGGVPLGAGFGERTSSLERRIRLMLDKAGGRDWRSMGLGLALAALLVAGACSLELTINVNPDDEEADAPAVSEVREAPAPGADPATEDTPAGPTAAGGQEGPATGTARVRVRPVERVVIPPPAGEAPAVESAVEESLQPPQVGGEDDADYSAGPTFTPFTVAPSIQNRDEVVRAMEAEYPPLLRDAGIGGTARMYFFIDTEGRVQDIRLDQSSGHPALDQAAMRVADVYRFSPALNRDELAPVWVSFPITFQVR